MRRRLLQTGLAGAALGVIGAIPPAASAATTTKTHAVGAFDRIVIDVPAEVDIRPGRDPGARITAERSVVEAIGFSVRGSTLTVTANRSFETREPIRIEIDCRSLAGLDAGASVDARVGPVTGERFALRAGGASSVAFESLNLAALESDIGGSASIRISGGRTASQRIRIGGSASYEAGEFAAKSVRIEADGSSDADIAASESLDATVSGAATVEYRGKPKLRQSVSGAGTLESR